MRAEYVFATDLPPKQEDYAWTRSIRFENEIIKIRKEQPHCRNNALVDARGTCLVCMKQCRKVRSVWVKPSRFADQRPQPYSRGSRRVVEMIYQALTKQSLQVIS